MQENMDLSFMKIPESGWGSSVNIVSEYRLDKQGSIPQSKGFFL
jgi:hypothetical protein